jgi:hypothetical protein
MAFDNVILTPHNAGSTESTPALRSTPPTNGSTSSMRCAAADQQAAWPKCSERFQKILGFKPEPLQEE